MSPPPPGAHRGERTQRTGLGAGLLVGALVGFALVAATIAVLQVVRPTLPPATLNPSTQSERPTVLPDNSSQRQPSDVVQTGTSPGVAAASPLDGATGVPPDAEVTLTFATDMIPATLSADSISVYDAARGANIAPELTFTYRRDAKQLTIGHATPGTTWGSGNSIDVEVTVAATDVAGHALAAPFRMTFSTR
ncbi:MAG: Ig-like domain-containing protein [Candidatus Andersenbacteria bacterium]